MNEYLIEFKCSNCEHRDYKECDFDLAQKIPFSAVLKEDHSVTEAGVGNYRCGKMQLHRIWMIYRKDTNGQQNSTDR